MKFVEPQIYKLFKYIANVYIKSKILRMLFYLACRHILYVDYFGRK